jgi:hypothetical protein
MNHWLEESKRAGERKLVLEGVQIPSIFLLRDKYSTLWVHIKQKKTEDLLEISDGEETPDKEETIKIIKCHLACSNTFTVKKIQTIFGAEFPYLCRLVDDQTVKNPFLGTHLCAQRSCAC